MLPFSKRETSAVSVFACIFIASPHGASAASILGALSSEYAQLLQVYALLIRQDTANNAADLDAAIAMATTVVGNLSATLNTMLASGDAGIKLAGMQIVAANALAALQKVQVAQDDE